MTAKDDGVNASKTGAKRLLIVNADDFGLTERINAGIADAHRNGILTSATIMANANAFAEAAGISGDNPGLGVGIHLNIVRGRPVSPPERVSALVGANGLFKPFRWRRLTPQFLAQAGREYRAQIEKVLAAGVTPTHIDFEKHHAWQGGLYSVACHLAEEYRIRAVRNLSEPVWWAVKNGGWPGAVHAAMAGLLRVGTALLGAGTRLARPDRLLGQTHIGMMDEARWLRVATCLPGGVSEMMVHPGYEEPGDAEGGGELGMGWIGRARRIELDALLSPAVRQALSDTGVELVDFRAL